MNEEKKEEKTEAQAPQTGASPQAATQAPAEASSGTGSAKEEKKVEPKRERPSNCAGCNKSIKKKRWYYRNGKFYCSQRCWKATLKKDSKQEEVKA